MYRATTPLTSLLTALLYMGPMGCGGTDSVGFLEEQRGQATTPSDPGRERSVPPGGTPRDGGRVAHPPPADASTDAGTSEPFVDDSDEAFCASADPAQASCPIAPLTSELFRHAVCTCDGIQGTGYLSTRSLGSDPLAASIALNGRMGLMIGHLAFPNQEPGRVDGDIVIAGDASSVITGVSGTQPFIRGDLRLAGLLLFGGNLHVGSSAWSSSMPLGLGRLRVDEDLTLAEGEATTQSPSIVEVGGETYTEPYTVDSPCPCGRNAPLDIDSTVSDAASRHDNASRVTSDALADVSGDPQLALPCGQYFLDSVDVRGNLELSLSGRTALYVGGDMTIDGDVRVQLAPGATLDLFIAGDLGVSGAARFAPPQRPAAARIYVGHALELQSAQDPADLSQPASALGDVVVSGNFYAPRAAFLLSANTDVYGSLFVGTFDVVQGVQVHHDPAVATQEACDASP